MNKIVIFTAGFALGMYFRGKMNGVFSDKCTIEGCGTRVYTLDPGQTIDAMHKHMLEKHPGWVQH